jgi:hypothetical protein
MFPSKYILFRFFHLKNINNSGPVMGPFIPYFLFNNFTKIVSVKSNKFKKVFIGKSADFFVLFSVFRINQEINKKPTKV